MIVIVLWLAFSVVAGVLAHNKGRSGAGFFFLALLLSPLIGIIAAAVVKVDDNKLANRVVKSGEGKTCPNCAEIVRPAARICRYCGSELKVSVAAPQSLRPVQETGLMSGGWSSLTGIQRMFLAVVLLVLGLIAAENFLM